MNDSGRSVQAASRVLQARARRGPRRPRRGRPRHGPPAGAARRRPRGPQRPALDRAAPRHARLPAPARRRRPAGARRPAPARRLRARGLRAARGRGTARRRAPPTPSRRSTPRGSKRRSAPSTASARDNRHARVRTRRVCGANAHRTAARPIGPADRARPAYPFRGTDGHRNEGWQLRQALLTCGLPTIVAAPLSRARRSPKGASLCRTAFALRCSCSCSSPSSPPAPAGRSAPTLAHRATRPSSPREQARVVAFARQLLGVRYTYGGTSPRSGFDCSGFTRFVYAHFGIALPHCSDAQFGLGRRVSRAGAAAGRPRLLRRARPRRHLRRRRPLHPRAAHRDARLAIEPLRGWYAAPLRRRPQRHLADVP